jgi:hypothetical protein
MRGYEQGKSVRRRRFLAFTSGALPVLATLPAFGQIPPGEATPARRAEGYLNVVDFGAEGDGKADDTAAIQAAIDAASASGGGMVLVPGGVYLTRTLTIASRVHLVGAGIEAAILRLRPDTNDDLIRSHQFAGLTGTNRPQGPYNWSIRDLTLDGNRARNAKGHGLRLYAWGYLLQNLRIRQCAQAGISSEWSTADPEESRDGLKTPGDSMEAQLVNIKVHHCGAGGIVFRGPHDSQFVNCVVYGTKTAGIHVQHGKAFSATGCQFVNCHVWGGHEYAWKIEAGYVTLDNCMGEWASTAQVLINDDDTTLSGCRFFGNPKAKHVGIEIGSSDRVVYGTQIDARMADLTGGALKFTNEGGSSKIKALIYQKSGLPYSGRPASDSLLEIAVNGVENGSYTRLTKGPLSWNGGTPIVRHLSGTASWEPPDVSHGAAVWTAVAVRGAAPGDTVAVGYSKPVPPGALLVGAVTAADVVTVTLLNQTSNSLKLEPGLLRADCWVH